ncbi:hypothetical protein GALMADRAFT_223781 [Galerina marginata CBS 339.88]|uniref:Uncharacterized protein n=1 Tax=Galerina marginata (strain CBS 339.88) TaxID=685588 RepID=A0A067T8Z4_GALM3|nr:hypothetical protein GALMADRAFT_223781 [Galerina marginata CBS 339.88]
MIRTFLLCPFPDGGSSTNVRLDFRARWVTGPTSQHHGDQYSNPYPPATPALSILVLRSPSSYVLVSSRSLYLYLQDF